VEPFLISSSLAAAIAQRLVRVLCQACREAHEPTDDELREIGLSRSEVTGHKVYRARGCPQCGNTGYRGRIAIFEILVVDDVIRKMITRGIDSKSIQDAAIERGMITMRMYGRQQVLAGVTSIAEILRQTEEAAVAALDDEPPTQTGA
jgi:type II secretory ATPase GspE/PulE/Tfp pilus assembly ATPase PilB-like protein